MPIDFDLEVKLAVYRHFAETAGRPSAEDIAEAVHAPAADVITAYSRLRAQRVLVLEADGTSIRMAPPFSGVATQHVVSAGGLSYFANCAWDSRLDQLWGLSQAWYSTRLQPDSRRPNPPEMREIFARLGLAGDFWDPEADTFGDGLA